MTTLGIEQNNKLPELSVIILCYQAGCFVKRFIDEVIEVLRQNDIFNYELILVANYREGVEDITPKIVKEIALSRPRVVCVAGAKQGMMGWDMKSGLNRAKGQYLMVIDGDEQVLAGDIIRVYRKIKEENLDLVKTYRVEREDGLERKLLTWHYNLLFKILFPGLAAQDINAKPKIFTRAAYRQLDLISNDWFIDAEIMIQARRLKFKIGEIPTVFRSLGNRRKSFIKFSAVLEFLKNLLIFRLKEFKQVKKL